MLPDDLSTLTDDDLDQAAHAIQAEQERRRTLAYAQATVEHYTHAVEAANTDTPPIPWTDLTDRVAPGQSVILDGITWRNTSGAWLPTTASPATYPLGWEQLTGLPDPETLFAWSEQAAYEVGDRVTRDGRIWECLTAHGAEYQGTWAPSAATPTVWRNVGPA